MMGEWFTRSGFWSSVTMCHQLAWLAWNCQSAGKVQFTNCILVLARGLTNSKHLKRQDNVCDGPADGTGPLNVRASAKINAEGTPLGPQGHLFLPGCRSICTCHSAESRPRKSVAISMTWDRHILPNECFQAFGQFGLIKFPIFPKILSQSWLGTPNRDPELHVYSRFLASAQGQA